MGDGKKTASSQASPQARLRSPTDKWKTPVASTVKQMPFPSKKHRRGPRPKKVLVYCGPGCLAHVPWAPQRSPRLSFHRVKSETATANKNSTFAGCPHQFINFLPVPPQMHPVPPKSKPYPPKAFRDSFSFCQPCGSHFPILIKALLVSPPHPPPPRFLPARNSPPPKKPHLSGRVIEKTCKMPIFFS